jgi:LmbE family N-acetylglucosaminyl deacetylase
MNIAAVGAHPDDIELLCGGTMAKYVQKGHRVTFIIATNGEAGAPAVSKDDIDQSDREKQLSGKTPESPTLAKEEIAAIRHEEAKEGARIIGADLIWLGYPDEFLFDTEETRLAVLGALRKAEADVVFAHYADLYNPDHNTIGKIVNDVGALLPHKNIVTDSPPLEENPYLYFMDTITGIGFEPDHYVDITDVFEIKKRALLAHKSQYYFLKELDGIDYLDMMETQAKLRGYQSNVKYAEAFIGLKAWPRGITRDLLPQYL